MLSWSPPRLRTSIAPPYLNILLPCGTRPPKGTRTRVLGNFVASPLTLYIEGLRRNRCSSSANFCVFGASRGNTKISERLKLQFRAEATNVFNHTNFDRIRTVFATSSFGRVRDTRDPRIMQLALKLYF